MSNRFVSAGKIGSSGEISTETKGAEPNAPQQPLHSSTKLKEWEVVQEQLEAERKRREEQRIKLATGEGEKSLYDVLQANKAAKQAEFEEQSKLRNQFRALDDDEIEFLDEVRAKKRAEEERVKQETEEGLKAFRERQKGDTVQDGPADAQEGGETWEIGRKRKRNKEKEVKGLRRKVSTAEETDKQDLKPPEITEQDGEKEVKPKTATQTASKPPEKKASGLIQHLFLLIAVHVANIGPHGLGGHGFNSPVPQAAEASLDPTLNLGLGNLDLSGASLDLRVILLVLEDELLLVLTIGLAPFAGGSGEAYGGDFTADLIGELAAVEEAVQTNESVAETEAVG
ncbi:hypothetical protein HG531_013938 [Fusarium graminearum]|nr:hypothetical protein HG531_013938 [Fusarium graminearum]